MACAPLARPGYGLGQRSCSRLQPRLSAAGSSLRTNAMQLSDCETPHSLEAGFSRRTQSPMAQCSGSTGQPAEVPRLVHHLRDCARLRWTTAPPHAGSTRLGRRQAGGYPTAAGKQSGEHASGRFDRTAHRGAVHLPRRAEGGGGWEGAWCTG